MALVYCAGYDVVNSTFGDRQDIKKVNCTYKPWNNNSMSYAFQNCLRLLNVSRINNSVNDMSYTFKDCHNLVELSFFPTSVKNIEGTFYNCESISNIPSLPSSIVSMVNTFYGCSSLYEIPELPNNVRNMSGTFYGCSNIYQDINIPNKVNDISYTFYGCSNIKSVNTIPSNVINMSHTFDGCTNLIGDIYISSTNIINAYNCFDNTPENKLKDIYITFEYENGVNTQTYDAFTNAGYSIDYRVNGAILVYDDLKDWRYDSLPNGMRLLYEYLGNKTNLVVPTKRTIINCSNGYYGYINSPFQNKQGKFHEVDLAFVPFQNNSMSWAFYASYNFGVERVYNINKNVKDMSNTFSLCPDFIYVDKIPDGVINMYHTFGHCTNLINAPVIPNSVTDMRSTFSDCYNLVNAPDIPEKVTSLSWTFSYCYNLVNAPDIPDHIIDMSYTFCGCNNINTIPIIIPNTVINMNGTFSSCPNLTFIPNIPDSVKNMERAFWNCQSLESVNMKINNVNNMTNCFERCYNLKDINLTINSKCNVYGLYNDCGNLRNVTLNIYDMTRQPLHWIYTNDHIVNYTLISEKFSNLSEYFFRMEHLEKVNLTLNNVTNMQDTFQWCYNLTNVCMNLKSPSDLIMFDTFLHCNNLANVIINSNSPIIMDSTFYECSNLKTINLCDSVIVMDNTFSRCYNLTNVVKMPSELREIHNAFYNCPNLTTIPTIGENVCNISYAFRDCPNLSGDIYIRSKIIFDAERAFWQEYIPDYKIKNVYIPFYDEDADDLYAWYESTPTSGYPTLLYTTTTSPLTNTEEQVFYENGKPFTLKNIVSVSPNNYISFGNESVNYIRDVSNDITEIHSQTYNAFINAGYTVEPDPYIGYLQGVRLKDLGTL